MSTATTDRPTTKWVQTPKLKVDLNYGTGKGSTRVTGTVTFHFTGENSVFVSTDGAHVNDDNPAVDYRGESWLVSAHYERDEHGNWDLYRSGGRNVTRRASWSDAPRTYEQAILLAVFDALKTVWNDEWARQGKHAYAAQTLVYLEKERETKAKELAELDARITTQIVRWWESEPKEVTADGDQR